jgi:flavodoxin
LERCRSGLTGGPGKTVYRKVPWVRIPPSPPKQIMKILVAYYSKTGNTERAAREIASKLGADIEKIIDKNNRKGIFGFIFGGRDAMKKRITEIETAVKKPADYDLTIIGTPVWASSMTPAARTYIDKNKGNLKQWAFFITSGNTEPESMVSEIEMISGKKAIAHVGFNAEELKKEEVYNKKMDGFIEAIKNSTGD